MKRNNNLGKLQKDEKIIQLGKLYYVILIIIIFNVFYFKWYKVHLF